MTVNLWVDLPDVTGYQYSMAVVGDTRIITRDCPENLSGIYSYIAENAESKSIVYSVSLGDFTHENTDAEWASVKNSLPCWTVMYPTL